ncbi:hypothetical protein [Paraburkholderia bannensis]|uniref:hypothetical protein n=1 Tax=Paraburkholderia bannensis TaxID=765414 RepID=UPI002AB7EED0|nr:hypothetical protein [Paraburkholderia bannensis]
MIAAVCTTLAVAVGGTACAYSSLDDHSIQSSESGQIPPDASGYQEIKKPTSQEEFFRNMKFVLDHGQFRRKEFYAKKNMYRYFAAVNVASGVEDETNGGGMLWMDATDFDGIFPSFQQSGTSVSGPGAQLGMQLSTNSENANVHAGFHFVTQRCQLTFEQIKQIFGGTLVMDRSIPHQPPPPPTGPHANEGWWYTLNTPQGNVYGYFGFDSAGLISDVIFSNKEINRF